MFSLHVGLMQPSHDLTFTLVFIILHSLPILCSINSMCTFKSMENTTSFKCDGVPFSKIPEFSQYYIYEVNIVNSGLEVLDKESFGATKVHTLRLMENKIISIEPTTFMLMEDVLHSLDLSNNRLQRLPVQVLRMLKNLNWLSLQSNNIVSLESEFPSDWSHLEETLHTLYLGGNDLQHLPSNLPISLKYLNKLSYLNLDSNNLKVIEPNSIPVSLQLLSASNNHVTLFSAKSIENLKHLSKISFRGNRINNIEEHTLSYVKLMDVLDLGENDLTSISSNPFNGSLKVKDLKLNNNKIKYLPAQAFKGLDVRRLDLSANKIETINDKAFEGLEVSLELLDLKRNNIFKIPKALLVLKKLKYFYISYNKILGLPDYAFVSFSQALTLLNLSGNLLNKIPKTALKNCIQLRQLNIGYNPVTEIISDDFADWGQSIETLDLRNHKLIILHEQIFKSTPNLKYLRLCFNQIQSIHPTGFSNIYNVLEHLEISYGLQLEDFSEDVLKPLNSLLRLSLDNNNLRTIQKTSLHSFGNLQYLNLESNMLEKLPQGLFDPKVHKNLRHINLAFNLLSEIQSDTFSSLLDLKSLTLNGNDITTLKPKAFNDLPRVITINLSDNSIEFIHPSAFTRIPNLTTLQMQGNNLKELSLGIFKNVSSIKQPLLLNVSNNEISGLFNSGPKTELYVESLDLSHNYILEIPNYFIKSLHKSLKRIHLGNNKISRLDANNFVYLELLEVFTLNNNKIFNLHKKTFVGLKNMQILDLSHNIIRQLEVGQFFNLVNLRHIDLSYNRIRSLPRDIFRGTKLENINLSSNEFAALPVGALAEIGYSLRYLDISKNSIEHIDSSMFYDTPFLISLNLCANKLTILPSNVFSHLGRVLRLEICHNKIKTHFKDLLTDAHNLRYLNIANISLFNTPVLSLPNLVSLNLSNNYLSDIQPLSFEKLKFLRSISINNNKFATVPSIWSKIRFLKALDLSSNPIKILTKSSFADLTYLETLNIGELPLLERLDSGTLSNQFILDSLKIQTWPQIEKYRFRLASVLAATPSVRTLSVNVFEQSLTDQLQGGFGVRLEQLTITGENLDSINADALDGIEKIGKLYLSIENTKISNLPHGLLINLLTIDNLTLDIRNDEIKSLHLDKLYNSTNLKNLDAKLVSGGLFLNCNRIQCNKSVLWLAEWVQRWVCESTSTLQIKRMTKATCSDPETKKIKLIFNTRKENALFQKHVPNKAIVVLEFSFCFFLGPGIPLFFWKFYHC